MYVFSRPQTYHYQLNKGMSGDEVAALQLNLAHFDVVVDGDYGDETEAAVKQFQQNKNMSIVDGIAGQSTQSLLIKDHCKNSQLNYSLPSNFLWSIAGHESGFIIGAYSDHPSDSGLDIGPFQISSGKSAPINQSVYISAYTIGAAAKKSAKAIREAYYSFPIVAQSRYLDEVGLGDMDRFRWQLAALNHNWPFAALNIAKYGHVYADDDAPQHWIELASGYKLHTTREWVTSYIQKATQLVNW
jgi:hypothetical protein